MTAIQAAPVRVLTWDLQPREAASDSATMMADAARVIKDLNPDVIVLQSVPDLQSCEELVRSLKPGDYQVAVLSSFPDQLTGGSNRRQVAILSRGKASNPDWGPWSGENQAAPAPGGYASAIIHLDSRTLGVFAVQLSDAAPPDAAARNNAAGQSAREDATRQLVRQIDSLRDLSNGVQALVVAGDFNTTPDDPALSRELTLTRLERAGFANAFGTLSSTRRVTLPGDGNRPDATVDYIFTRDAGQITGIQTVPGTLALHRPVVGDLEVGPLAAQTTASAGAAGQTDAAPTLGSFWQTLKQQVGLENVWWLGGLLAGGVVFIGAGTLLIAKRRPGQSVKDVSGGSILSPPNASEILVMTRSTQTGSITRPGAAMGSSPVVHIQSAYPQSRTEAQEWQRRAERAEQRADRATAALRAGLLPQLSQWLKDKLTRKLVSDREQLLEAQRMAARKMEVVDERLTKVELHIQRRTREYEIRIDALEKELAEAREENRELIRAKIAQVRAEMERERARLMQHARDGV